MDDIGVTLVNSRLDAQGRRLDAVESEMREVMHAMQSDLPSLRTEVRLMTEAFRSFRNAMYGAVGVIVAGSVAIIIHGVPGAS